MAIAFSSITGYFTDLGVTHTLIREGTKPNPDMPRLLGGALKLRLLFAMGSTIISIILITSLYHGNHTLRMVVLLISIPIIWGNALLGIGTVYFQVIQNMKYTALIRCINGSITALILISAMFFNWSIIFLSLAYGLSSLISGVMSVTMVIKRIPTIGGWHSGLLDGIWSFTFGGIFILSLPQLGPIILERVTSLTEVGNFTAAYRIPAVLYTIPGVLATACYPQLFHHGARDLEQHFRLSVNETKWMSMLAIGIALPFALYSHVVIHTLFGDKWSNSTTHTLSLLAWMVALQGINYPLADALATKGLQFRRMSVLAIATTIGVFSYFFLGSHFGAWGAAISAIIIEFCLLFGYTISNPTGWKLLWHSLIPPLRYLIPVIILLWVLKSITHLQFLGAILTPILYIALLYLMDKDVRQMFNKFIHRKANIDI